MSTWNRAALDDIDEAIIKQDEAFCEMLRTAIKKGAESCPIGVSAEPGTKKSFRRLS